MFYFWVVTYSVAALTVLLCVILLFNFGILWLQARASGVSINILTLLGMRLRNVSPTQIVRAIIMAKKAGLKDELDLDISTKKLENHVLAGGDVTRVMLAIISAHRAHIHLGFDRAAAIDLAGRDILDAVRTSVNPRVISCPSEGHGKKTLSAISKDGIELRVLAKVTVRTNLDQLIGGATEETIVARVGEGIITAIGSAEHHMDVLGLPENISNMVLSKGLESNTAFEVVSIDIADISVGHNIGARLQADQAEADTRVATAAAEKRRADAVALKNEMTAELRLKKAELLAAESKIPVAMAKAIISGNIASFDIEDEFWNSRGSETDSL